jgi:hypothetical protein
VTVIARFFVVVVAILLPAGCGSPETDVRGDPTDPLTVSSVPSSTAVEQPPSSASPPSPTTLNDAACLEKKKDSVREGAVDVPVGKGLDLDCGRTTDRPDGSGADITVEAGGGVLLVVDPFAGAAWVDDLPEDDFSRCAALPDTAYLRSLTGLDQQPTPDRNICVRTSEDNQAIVRLDMASTAAEPSLNVHYLIEYAPGS